MCGRARHAGGRASGDWRVCGRTITTNAIRSIRSASTIGLRSPMDLLACAGKRAGVKMLWSYGRGMSGRARGLCRSLLTFLPFSLRASILHVSLFFFSVLNDSGELSAGEG